MNIKAGIQSKNLEAEQKQETEERCMLACFPWLAQLPFSYSPGPLDQVQHHLQWAGSSYQENGDTDKPTGQTNEGKSLVESPSSQVCLGLHQVDFKRLISIRGKGGDDFLCLVF